MKSYHNIMDLAKYAADFQTVSTPNVLNIYLLSQVSADMLNRSIQMIRSEIRYKAAVFYKMIDSHSKLRPFVSEKPLRSETVIVLSSGEHTKNIIEYLAEKNMIIGTGYGKHKTDHVRIANFPTHSKEQFEMLTDLVEKW